MEFGSVGIQIDSALEKPQRLDLATRALFHQRPTDVVMRLRARGSLLEHLAQHHKGLVGSPNDNQHAPYAELQVGVVGSLGERELKLLDSVGDLPQVFEKLPSFEHEPGIVGIHRGDAIELRARIRKQVCLAKRDRQLKPRHRSMRVTRDRRLVARDGLGKVALLFGHLTECAVECNRRR